MNSPERLSTLKNGILKKFTISLGAKIFVIVFIVTVSITGAISYAVISRITSHINVMETNRAKVILTSIQETLKEKQSDLAVYARAVAENLDLKQALQEVDYRRAEKILQPARAHSKHDRFLIYNRHQDLVVKIPGNNDSNTWEVGAQAKALAGETNSVIGIGDKGLELITATPISANKPGNQGDLAEGALVIEHIINEQELLRLKREYGAELAVIYKGQVITSTLDAELARQMTNSLKQSVAVNQLYFHFKDKKQLDYRCVWRFYGKDGFFVAMVSNSDLVAMGRQITLDIIFITFVAGTILLILSLAISKLLIRPLLTMLQTTAAVTVGDFDQRVNVSSTDEFGQLGQAINFMIEKIGDRLSKAEYLANVDGLTGLYNHRYFQQRLGEELERAAALNLPLAIVLIDIDYFKHYNDTNGHPTGDKLLQQISRILENCIRSADVAARYGGEEFVLILQNTAPEAAVLVGERVRKEVEQFPFEGRKEQPTGKVTVSVGIAAFPLHATKKEDLIRSADDALYKAKYIGKNKVVFYYSVLDELKSEIDLSQRDMLKTIKALITVINTKDKFTYAHSERVVHYALQVADRMGINESDIKALKVGAYLHDIGKIEIDREILNNPENLTDEQIEILKQHPAWGAQIVSCVISLQAVAPIILHHHENFDGTGYPLGLVGEAIPLLARILRVVDSFDEMTTNRPNLPRLDLQDAKEQLKQGAGGEYDPEIVEVFLDLLEKQPQAMGQRTQA